MLYQSFAPGVMEALQVSIERYTREAMRGVQGSIPCGAIKFRTVGRVVEGDGL